MTDTTFAPTPARVQSPGADWRLEIPENRRRAMRIWLGAVALMTLGVVVVGGITRLTLSGLSIVEWNPLMGVIPPIGHEAWQRAFEAYQQTPDYEWRSGMTLDDFRFIFFWEYLHRLLARTIGLVFLVPFVVFWAKGWFNRPLLKRGWVLFGLGAAQGLMGWLMVASGLVERPAVSHYRLAAHLSLAFTIFGFCVWLMRDLALGATRETMRASVRRWLEPATLAVGALLMIQIVWGAFVAGLRGGKFYPTFPRMGGEWVPRELLYQEPAAVNFVANAIAVQWTHRVLGTLLLIAAVALAVRVVRAGVDATTRRFAVAFGGGVALQYALGIFTLVNLVPVSLGVLHQLFALLLLGVWLAWLHRTRNIEPVPG